MQQVFVINLPRRTDRRRETEAELRRIGWEAEFFSAVEPPDAGGFPSRGARGCFLSHLGVLKAAREHGVKRLIILEDDVSFVPDFAERWRAVEAFLAPSDCSILYPGHVMTGDLRGILPVAADTAVRCTHCLVIDAAAIPVLIGGLETILSRPPGHPDGGPMHVDGAYSTLRKQNPALATFACWPSLAGQRPSRTDIAAAKWFDRIEALAPAVRLARGMKARLQRPA